MGGGGITAAGLIVLLLALIGLGVGLYYAYICIRARPVRPRQHTDCEDGPLIAVDPDVNGNHEDVPVEASAPVDDESDAKTKLLPDDADKGKVADKEVNGSIDGIPNGPTKEKDAVLLPIEEMPEPTKMFVENETVPVISHVAPAGFIAPVGFVAPVAQISQDGTPVHPNTPKKVESAHQERAEPEVFHPVNSPVPIFVPVGKKAVTDSDEEDGLLLQKCLPHDDSLENKEQPAEEQKVKEVPESPVNLLEGKEPLASQPETVEIKSEAEPSGESNDIKEKEPEVVADVLDDFVDKEEVKDPQPVLIKEEEENLQPVTEVSEPAEPVDEPCSTSTTVQEQPTTETLEPTEPVDESFNTNSAIQEQPVSEALEPAGLVDEPCNTSTVVSESSMADDTSIPENEIHPDPLEKVEDKLAKEPAEDIESVPEAKETVSKKASEVPEVAEYPSVVYLETREPSLDTKEVEMTETPIDEVLSPEEVSDAVVSIGSVTPEEEVTEMTQPSENSLAMSAPESEFIPVSQEEDTNIPQIVVSQEDCKDIPEEVNTNVATSALEPASEPVVNVKETDPVEVPPVDSTSEPIDATVPLEAEGPYYSDSADDANTLDVINEEGSVDTESVTSSDTETSDPEVTQYTFACGPLVPSTKTILADELSSALEPKVTKYAKISEPDSVDLESERVEEELDVSVKPVVVIAENADESEVEENYPAEVVSPTTDNEKSPEAVTTEETLLATDNVGTKLESSVSEHDEKFTPKEVCDVEPAKMKAEEKVPVPNTDTDKDQPDGGDPVTDPAVQSQVSSLPQSDESKSDTSGSSSEHSTEGQDEVSSSEPTKADTAGADEGKLHEVCEGDPANGDCKEPIPQVTILNVQDQNNTSLLDSTLSSASSSSSPDTSDSEVMLPDPPKSKIPRLVERHGS